MNETWTGTTQIRFLKKEVDLNSPAHSRRVFCKPCLDWSERRFHLAGVLGTAIWHRCLALDWLARERATRLVRVTRAGERGLRQTLGLDLTALTSSSPFDPVRLAEPVA